MPQQQAGEPGPRAMPSLGTSVGGNATVGTLATIGHADTVQFAAGAVPQALYQLPADISDFVGRVELQAELLAHFRGASAPVGVAGPRIALYGPAGVGKSALAVRVAHSIADIFPDAQLYIDLGAGAGKPVAAMDALASFLRALGVEGPYPDSLDERSSTFRAHLAAMRALIVLDNAGTLEQVTPLLPGASTCAVIVTSRRSLGALEGALSRTSSFSTAITRSCCSRNLQDLLGSTPSLRQHTRSCGTVDAYP